MFVFASRDGRSINSCLKETGIFIQLDFAEDGPGVDTLLTTDFGFVVSANRVTIDFEELFISIDQACELLAGIPRRPSQIELGIHVLAYREFNPEDHAGALLMCDDMFRVKQPPEEYEAESVPACPFYVPRTDAVHIGNVPKAPIGTAQNCFILSSAALRLFEAHSEGTIVPLFVNGTLRKSYSAWFPQKVERILDPIAGEARQYTCLSCGIQCKPSPADGSCYGGPAELPKLAVDATGFGHYASRHEVFVSIDLLGDFHKQFRKMIGLLPVYRSSHKYVMAARQILSAVSVGS